MVRKRWREIHDEVIAEAIARDKQDHAEGKVTKWETTTRTVTFDDGSTYQFNETVKTESLKEGARIKVTYEEKDGKMMATKYEVIQ